MPVARDRIAAQRDAVTLARLQVQHEGERPKCFGIVGEQRHDDAPEMDRSILAVRAAHVAGHALLSRT